MSNNAQIGPRDWMKSEHLGALLSRPKRLQRVGCLCPSLCFEAGITAQHPAGPGTPASTLSVACSDGIWVQEGKGARCLKTHEIPANVNLWLKSCRVDMLLVSLELIP